MYGMGIKWGFLIHNGESGYMENRKKIAQSMLSEDTVIILHMIIQ